MARTSRTILIVALIALSAAACGRRGKLDAPPGAMPTAPDVTTRQPRQKPPEVTPAEPQPVPKPETVKDAPAP
ncbi:MAG: hypothetical protein IT548_11455 [Alphaproteobacteria bacterium]|nr:hypothetical protein [Alphaproteobacteria bacterium]